MGTAIKSNYFSLQLNKGNENETEPSKRPAGERKGKSTRGYYASPAELGKRRKTSDCARNV